VQKNCKELSVSSVKNIGLYLSVCLCMLLPMLSNPFAATELLVECLWTFAW